MKLKEFPYRSTKRTRAVAKAVTAFMTGERSDLPGFTRRPWIKPEEVKAVRRQQDLTQAALAHLLRQDVSAVENWEQGRRQPDGPVATLLMLLAVYKPTRGLLAGKLERDFRKVIGSLRIVKGSAKTARRAPEPVEKRAAHVRFA